MNKHFRLQTRVSQYTVLVIGFCFLSLLQVAFLPHLGLGNTQANLIFIAVFLLNFLALPASQADKKGTVLGLWAGVAGGLLLDFFSTSPFGVFAFTLLALSFLIQKSQVLFHRTNFLSFGIVFLLSFLFYKLCLSILAMLLLLLLERRFVFYLPFQLSLGVEFLYNFLITGFVFLVFKLKKGKR